VKLSIIALDDPAVSLVGKEPVFADDVVVGYVTSANTAWSTGQSLALAYVPVELADEGTAVAIEYFGVRHAGRIIEGPVRPSKPARRRSAAVVS
jgi:glycine cleavage system aminomethyltransferase T